MADVFAFVILKPCGCIVTACTPRSLSDTMRQKHFRQAMKAGHVHTVTTQEEWNKMKFYCDVCKERTVSQ